MPYIQRLLLGASRCLIQQVSLVSIYGRRITSGSGRQESEDLHFSQCGGLLVVVLLESNQSSK